MSEAAHATGYSSAFFRTDSHSWPPRSERHLQACHPYEGSRHRFVAMFLSTSDSCQGSLLLGQQ